MTESIPGRRPAPILLVASGPAERRAAVVEQLEDRYASSYDVVSVATSAEAALALRRASDNVRHVAVLLADDAGELPHGRTVFQVAAELVPDVRRGLLVEWGAWGECHGRMT